MEKESHEPWLTKATCWNFGSRKIFFKFSSESGYFSEKN